MCAAAAVAALLLLLLLVLALLGAPRLPLLTAQLAGVLLRAHHWRVFCTSLPLC
jgi:hypothetical protein